MTHFTITPLTIELTDRDPLTIWFDGNSKITRGGGSFEQPVANAFSLPQIIACPHATPTCSDLCYVHRLEQAEAEVHAKYRENLAALQWFVGKFGSHQSAADQMAAWISEHCQQSGFRWHVSGDIISRDHAWFIRNVCERAEDVDFWLYTRSFDHVIELWDVDNLTVNLSADRDNIAAALQMHRTFGFRVCYLATDLPNKESFELPQGSVIFPTHALRQGGVHSDFWRQLSQPARQAVCPADLLGQSPHFRCGPCKKCLRPLEHAR